VPKIIKFDGDMTKFWQKQIGSFLAHPVYYTSKVGTSTPGAWAAVWRHHWIKCNDIPENRVRTI